VYSAPIAQSDPHAGVAPIQTEILQNEFVLFGAIYHGEAATDSLEEFLPCALSRSVPIARVVVVVEQLEITFGSRIVYWGSLMQDVGRPERIAPEHADEEQESFPHHVA
jgi:hypothetical protein